MYFVPIQWGKWGEGEGRTNEEMFRKEETLFNEERIWVIPE